MSNIVRLPERGSRSPSADPYRAFCESRRDMMRAFAAWLATRPEPSLAEDERAGTESMLDQMRILLTGGGNA